jgi:Reverse transcriptase (RNA-dependent DNA polymerase)
MKRNRTLRPVVDYRALYEVKMRNFYLLPLIKNLLDQLGVARVFSKIDLHSAFNLIRVSSESQCLTAFRCKYNHYEYRVKPFVLITAPATFDTFISYIFRDLMHHTLIVYLDDILIYSKDQESHNNTPREVFQRLKRYQLFINKEESTFKVPRLTFLGYIISHDPISPDR